MRTPQRDTRVKRTSLHALKRSFCCNFVPFSLNRSLPVVQCVCSAHLDERSKHHHVSLKSRFNQRSPEALYRCFRKTLRPRALFTLQWYFDNPPDCLRNRLSLYAGADWLSSSVSQRVARGQLGHQARVSHLVSYFNVPVQLTKAFRASST